MTVFFLDSFLWVKVITGNWKLDIVSKKIKGFFTGCVPGAPHHALGT